MEWTSQDWASNVIVAAIYRLGDVGPMALSIGFSLLVVGAAVLLWRGISLRSPDTGWLSRLVWLTVGITVAGPVVGVRIQVVDLPLAAATMVVCWHFLAHRRPAILLWLPVLAVAWANMHAGWLLLFLLGGAVVVGEAVDRMFARHPDSRSLQWREIGWLAGAGILALAAICVNPNGPDIYLYPVETASIAAHRDFLAEWSPPDLASLPGWLYVGFIVLGVMPALALGWRRMRTADVLVLLGLTVMAGTAARFLLVAGPIGAAIIACTLPPFVERSAVGRVTGPIIRRMARPPRRPMLGAMNVVLAAVLVVTGSAITITRVSPPAQEAAIADHMPVGAVDWIVANNPGSKPFNTYSWGGYLGFRRPDALVFIDGRSDIYGDEPIRAYAGAVSLRSDPNDLLQAYEIDHVLFNTDHPFADWLRGQPSWTVSYTDPLATVWVRSGGHR